MFLSVCQEAAEAAGGALEGLTNGELGASLAEAAEGAAGALEAAGNIAGAVGAVAGAVQALAGGQQGGAVPEEVNGNTPKERWNRWSFEAQKIANFDYKLHVSLLRLCARS